MCKELRRLTQGYYYTKGTNMCIPLTINKTHNILANRTITCAGIVVNYRPQTYDQCRVCVTVGGNLIKYPGKNTTTTANMVTSKLLCNSLLSTPNARYACFDIANVYLQTLMIQREYLRISINVIPEKFMICHDLYDKIYKNYIYFEIQKECLISHKLED